ncbi:GNAT family N-acetyltransferase [Candidatus Poribacteria bacterium]|nr:GNAT family N-acetyltransferase [Candidatus Poribacteria bacterium]
MSLQIKQSPFFWSKLMKNIGVTLFREDILDIPDFNFPEGFRVRNFKPGEGNIWTRIQRAAEPFFEIEDNLFKKQFGEHLDQLPDRSFFVITEDGHEVGSITAWWYNNWRDKDWGLIHWVAVHPDYQGRGICKAMMTVAMNRLKQDHDRAMLNTSTGRVAAIKVYLDFGFKPDMQKDNSREAWSNFYSVLPHPALKEYDL